MNIRQAINRYEDTRELLKQYVNLMYIADIHGPYELNYEGTDVMKCITCNTLWPCRTFVMLKNFSLEQRRNTMDKCHCGREIYVHTDIDNFTRGLCKDCDNARCDAYPMDCPWQ